MAGAISSCGDGRNGTGMSDSVRHVQDLAQDQAKTLRGHATSLLQEAAQCGDPVRRDDLLRAVVARLDEARRLLDQPDGTSEDFGPGHSARRNH